MRFKKGQSGNPGGHWSEKPFRAALRMEIAAAGKNSKALREIARALLEKAAKGEIPAIKEIADRLDGKPAQEVISNSSEKQDATDWTDEELIAVIRNSKDNSKRAGDNPALQN